MSLFRPAPYRPRRRAWVPSGVTQLHHWLLDSDRNDSVGSWNLTDEGTPTHTSGAPNKANSVDLDGSTDAAWYNDDFTGAATLSITGWIYPEAAAAYALSISNASGLSNIQLYLYVNSDNTLQLGVRSGGTTDNWNTTVTSEEVDLNEWNFVAIVFDGRNSNAKLYADVSASHDTLSEWLSETTTGTTLSAPAGGAGDFAIGATRNATTTWQTFFNGRVDDVRVYSSVLSQAQIEAIRDDVQAGATINLLANVASASTTPDTPKAAIQRDIIANAISASTTPDTPVLSVLRDIIANAASASTTPDTVNLAFVIQILANVASASTTPDTPLLLVLRNVLANDASASTTPDTPVLAVLRDLLANDASASTTPDTVNLNLTALINLIANIASASTTPDTPVLAVLRDLLANDASASTTPDTAVLAVLRDLLANDASASTTPDTVNLLIPGSTATIPIERLLDLAARQSVIKPPATKRVLN